MIRSGLIVLCIICAARGDQLEQYIEQGLKNNLALQQKNFSYQKSIQALNEARGAYLPSLDILARYSRAGGGRTFEMPIGDIANPIYEALNLPVRLENVVVPFLRPEEQETKLRLIQPIFQPAIHYNYKMKTEMKEIEQLAILVYKRYLISEIKTAYFNYMMTIQVIKLLNETRTLLEENVRVSEHLYQNEKVTKDAVYRAQAELSALDQNLAESDNRLVQSRAYFNFLINRPLETTILIDDTTGFHEPVNAGYDQLCEEAWRNREELKQMGHVLSAVSFHGKIARSAYLPGISGVVDYGIQGEQYRFTGNDDYWMASLVLQWNLFKGFQDQAKRQQIKLDHDEKELQYRELRRKITLEVRQIYDRCQAVLKKIKASEQREKSARSSFIIVQKKYREGMASQIEFLDARSTLTDAQVKNILAGFEYQVSRSELERVLAGYPLEEPDE